MKIDLTCPVELWQYAMPDGERSECTFVMNNLMLPLGISFFTFQQLSYVIDSYRRTVPRYNILDYALFVTFFPQLVAGPIVLHSEIVPQFADVKNRHFNFDNFAGCSDMLEHLLASGRRKIVLLNGSKEHFFSQAMEKAYRQKLAQYRIKVNEEMILHADFTAPGAAEVMQKFMRKNIGFDAVFSNDEMALGVYRTLLSCNISIPQQVALAGCDNLPLGQMLYPALSTVDLDYGLLADAAIKFILEREEVFTPKRLLIKPKLLIRESTL